MRRWWWPFPDDKDLAETIEAFAPHLADEIWERAGGEGLVGSSRWPKPDPGALVQRIVRVAVQINGKLRGQVDVAADASEEAIAEAASSDANVARHLEGKTLRKQIVVPGRLINFVVSG